MKKLLIATAMTLCSHAAFADVAVIVNPANGNALAEGTFKQLPWQAKSFDGGTKVNPVNQDGNSVSDI